jgi:gluconokinase
MTSTGSGPGPIRPLVVVVMGVSGTGKSTVAAGLVRDLGWPFAEGDDFHSAANIAKMHAGHPLTDADRRPWLQAISAWIGARGAAGTGGIVTCSALKRSYREILRAGHPDVRFLCLTGSHQLLESRIENRVGHFMPASLLDSQLDTLEPLQPDEPGVTIDVSGSPDEVERIALAQIRTMSADGLPEKVPDPEGDRG